MTVQDFLQKAYELHELMTEHLPAKQLLDVTILMAVWLFSRELARENTRFLRFLVFGHANSEIEIIDDSNGTLLMKHPLNVQDIHDYLELLHGRDSRALRGIAQIRISDRPSNLHSNVMGSYTPKHGGAVICLFPMGYNPLRNQYTLDFSDVGTVKIGYSPEEAKNLLLFTLGHEIGHNVRYRKDRGMFGDEVERFCDEYSAKLGIVPDPEAEKIGEMFHIDDAMRG